MEIGKITISVYDVLKIEELTITSGINDHGRLTLVALIEKELANTYLAYEKNGREISVQEEGRVLFQGITTAIRCSAEKEFMQMELKAESYSSLLDRKKKTRSFQDTSMMLRELVDTVLGGEKKVPCMFYIQNEKVGELLVQYKETDWEFLKRVASKYHAGIFSSIIQKGKHLIWGMDTTGQPQNIHVTGVTIKKDMGIYRSNLKNDVKNIAEQDAVIYELESDQFLLVGDAIVYDEKKLYITKTYCNMNQADFRARYQARTEKGLKVQRTYNDNLVGAALEGTILAVSGEKIQTHLIVDEKQDKDKAYWFPFSSMAASSDGSGWYYMPEVGDCVKVCFPDWQENNAFAVSAVSNYQAKDGEDDKMGNTDIKYMRNPSGKNLSLSPDGIQAESNGGQSLMELQTDGTIRMNSKNTLTMTASEMIEIVVGVDMEVEADTQIDIVSDKSGELQMNESGEIRELGGQVNINIE